MKTFLLILSILAFLYGFLILASAKSAVHEIEAFVVYLIGAVFLSGSAIVGAINSITLNAEEVDERNYPQSAATSKWSNKKQD